MELSIHFIKTPANNKLINLLRFDFDKNVPIIFLVQFRNSKNNWQFILLFLADYQLFIKWHFGIQSDSI